MYIYKFPINIAAKVSQHNIYVENTLDNLSLYETTSLDFKNTNEVKLMMNSFKRKLKKIYFLVYSSINEAIDFMIRYILGLFCTFLSLFFCKKLLKKKYLYKVNAAKLVRKAHLFVEIGAGHGELARFLSKQNPDTLLCTFEIKSRFYRKTASALRRYPNAIAFKSDGYKDLLKLFANSSVDKIFIMFPDPWNKKRHFKRRRITCEWLCKAVSILAPGGWLLIATDHSDYYNFIKGQVDNCLCLKKRGVVIKKGKYIPEKFNLVQTHYYKKAIKMGNLPRYFLIKKKIV